MMRKMIFLLCLGMAVFLSATASAHFWNGKCKGKECPLSMGKGQCECSQCSCQCPIMDKFMMKAHFLLENKSEIGLTDDQVKAIKALKLQMEKDGIRQGADKKTFQLDLMAKLSEDKVDVEGASALIDQNFTTAAAAAKSNVANYAKLKEILSPAQMTNMKALHERMEKNEKEK